VKGRALDWVRGRRSQYVEFDALCDVNLCIQPGEAVAVLGRNGAGKSTLLKILAGVVEPDRGHVEVKGRVSPLLELGAGFSPELSGRRNTYLYGALLGLRRREIDAQLQSIVEFSEIGEFFDSPVKHYSTGMYLRLAFAIAAHLDPDILLLDEVLSVGDAGFQAKCMGRIHDFRRSDKTLVIVTHAVQQIVELCDRAILIEHGIVVDDGPPGRVGDAYMHRLSTIT
jgi:ABC-2 type transport system ATP-binding protein